MRARSHNTRVLLGQRPFADGPGASLYVGTPNGRSIRYRRLKPVGPASRWYAQSTTATIDPGADSVDKTQRVATADSPATQMTYTLPASLLNVDVAVQVRTFQNDRENQTIYRPVIVGVDGSGEQNDEVRGSVTVLAIEKRDAGGLLVRIAWTPSRDGVQPETLRLRKSSGAGTVADVDVVPNDAIRLYEFEVEGLSNGVTYGFVVQGIAGAVTTALASLEFTADSAGPTSVTVTAVPL